MVRTGGANHVHYITIYSHESFFNLKKGYYFGVIKIIT